MVRFMMQVKVSNTNNAGENIQRIAETPVPIMQSNSLHGVSIGAQMRYIAKVKQRHQTNEGIETNSVPEIQASHTERENIEPNAMLLNLTLSDKAEYEFTETEAKPSKEKQRKGMSNGTLGKVMGSNDDDVLPGPFFCYLMIQLGGPCKNEAKVLVARECFEDAYRHNSGEINDKGTKAARGLWQVEMIVGPFRLHWEAEDFKKLWMQDSRGIIPRRDRAIELINEGRVGEHIRCYDKRLVPLNLNIWLTENDMLCLMLPDDRLKQLYYDCGRLSKMGGAHTLIV